MVVALIPARGGSKRLPGKNLKLFAGRPLLAYSIALARAIAAIDRCVVSTEDAEIARTARAYGAEVIDRPERLATDTATTASVARHALEQLIAQGERPAVLLTLQPNCPLRPPALVREALARFDARGHEIDSVVSVTANTHKLGKIDGGLFCPEYATGARSQDLAPAYYENGLVYVTHASVVLERESVFGERILPLITEPLYAMGDIDTELDFQIAEFLFRKYQDQFELPMDGQETACARSR
jgi:CMP-N-acetylneuraminic acid synthetase